jgi:AcrR family transcriptional regulator
MTRTYTLRRRAEQQAETRRRIVETAVDLHGSIGPARTSFSMIAEQAGVQRHTLYAHFPDELSLLAACSGLVAERDPMPQAEPWQAIGEPRRRLREGLSAIYAWFDRNSALLACVLRDAETHAPTRQAVEMRLGPFMMSYRQVLGAGLNRQQRALLELALSFSTWRTLARDAGLKSANAVKTMVQAIYAAK